VYIKLELDATPNVHVLAYLIAELFRQMSILADNFLNLLS
jgi:hypothetical protein